MFCVLLHSVDFYSLSYLVCHTTALTSFIIIDFTHFLSLACVKKSIDSLQSDCFTNAPLRRHREAVLVLI